MLFIDADIICFEDGELELFCGHAPRDLRGVSTVRTVGRYRPVAVSL